MQGRGCHGMLNALGSTHWGLLPALAILLWMGARPLGAGPHAFFLVLALLMASFDLAERRIPNVLNLTGLVAGLLLAALTGGPVALLGALAGAAVGFGLMAVFFFMGAVGAGDVKALAALGAFCGAWGAVELFLLTTLCGGALALASLGWSWARQGRLPDAAARRAMSMPYGVAIAGGACWWLLTRGGL